MISFYFYKYSLILLISIIISNVIYKKYSEKNKKLEKKEENNETILDRLKKYIRKYKKLIITESQQNNYYKSEEQIIDMSNNDTNNDANNDENKDKTSDVEENENKDKDNLYKEPLSDIYIPILNEIQDIINFNSDQNIEKKDTINPSPDNDIISNIDIISSTLNILKDNLSENNIENRNIIKKTRGRKPKNIKT